MTLKRRSFLGGLIAAAFAPAAVAAPLYSPTVYKGVCYFDVTDFGADPTGRLDSTEAFQRCVDAANAYGDASGRPATVRLPAGSFFIPGGVSLPGEVHFKGM